VLVFFRPLVWEWNLCGKVICGYLKEESQTVRHQSMQPSRSSPRVSTALLPQVDQQDYFGVPGEIYCLTFDTTDKITYAFTRNALYIVAVNGTTALVSGDEYESGFADGMRAEARYDGPRGMVLDREKKLMYVVDTGNHVLRIISMLSGFVHTVAGRGQENGFLDGAGGAARFSFPISIVLCSNGSIYICDRQNHSLRHVALGGHHINQYGPFMGNPLPATVTTFCGGTMYGARALPYVDDPFLPALDTVTLHGARDGPCLVALFHNPMGIALDSNGNIIVTDSGNNMIRSVNLKSGVTSTLVGMKSADSRQQGRWHCDGPREVAIINHPTSVDVDDFDNIIIADCYNNQIRVLRTCGRMHTLAGGGAQDADGRPPPDQTPVDGRGASVRFNQPQQVMLDNGVLHVVEKSNEFWTRRLKYTASEA